MVKRQSTADWEEAALQAVAANGLDALSIPELARTLGVTKGSFYWHFRSLRDLIRINRYLGGYRTLHHVEKLERELGILLVVRGLDAPHQEIGGVAARRKPKRPNAIFHEFGAVRIGRRVSERRLAFLLRAYRQLGLAAADARTRALLSYAAYVGALHLRRQRAPGLSTEKHLAAFVAHAVETLIP